MSKSVHRLTYYILDRTFKKGTNTLEAQRKRAVGQDVSDAYNPNPVGVYLCCSTGKTFIKVHTGEKVKPIHWDFNKQLAGRKHPMSLEVNALLTSARMKADQEIMARRLARQPITPEEAKEILYNAVGKPVEQPVVKLKKLMAEPEPADTKEKVNLFWEAYATYMVEHRQLSKPGTLKKYTALEQLLRDFERERYPIGFAEMTLQFITDFKLYSYESRAHQDNTVGKNIKGLKAFLKWAELHPKRYNAHQDYKRFTSNNVEGEVLFLSVAELAKLENYDCRGHRGRTLAKDFFLFQCYTGQRYSDVAAVRPADIRKSESDDYFEWTLYQIKGNKSNATVVPLLEKAKEIYLNYSARTDTKGKLFPEISNILLNKYVKEIAKAAGINAPITKVGYSGSKRLERTEPKWVFVSSHMARRTFVSLSLERGMRPELVQAITGHTTQKVMKRYIGINRSALASELRECWASQ